MRNTAFLMWLTLVVACPAAPAQTASLDELLAKVAKWDYHDTREPLFAVTDLLMKGGTAAQRQAETRFIGFLKSDATMAGKVSSAVN